MIPTLLWRCPLCATNDALAQTNRPLRASIVRCRQCSAAWQVRRVPGDDFYLKPLAGAPGGSAERPLSAWYDQMKGTVRLAPIHDAAVQPAAGEDLYLASGAAQLEAEESDPLFFPGRSGEIGRVEKREVGGVDVGGGRLFLTSQRLVWLPHTIRTWGDSGGVSFPLRHVNSAYAMMDFGLLFLIGLRLYAVYFSEESILKWVHYLALIARQVLAETGHRLTTSHF